MCHLKTGPCTKDDNGIIIFKHPVASINHLMFSLSLTNATSIVFRWLCDYSHAVTFHSLSHYLYIVFRSYKAILKYIFMRKLLHLTDYELREALIIIKFQVKIV
jgi:hypothetical protein